MLWEIGEVVGMEVRNVPCRRTAASHRRLTSARVVQRLGSAWVARLFYGHRRKGVRVKGAGGGLAEARHQHGPRAGHRSVPERTHAIHSAKVSTANGVSPPSHRAGRVNLLQRTHPQFVRRPQQVR